MIINDRLIIEKENILSSIQVIKIMYFTNIEVRSEFFTDNFENYIYEKSLLGIEKELKQDYFFRVHCNYIVNINYINEIILNCKPIIKLHNDILIPVSERRKYSLLKKIKESYYQT